MQELHPGQDTAHRRTWWVIQLSTINVLFPFDWPHMLIWANVSQVTSAREKTCWLTAAATSTHPAPGSTSVRAVWPTAAVASTSIACRVACSLIRYLICHNKDVQGVWFCYSNQTQINFARLQGLYNLKWCSVNSRSWILLWKRKKPNWTHAPSLISYSNLCSSTSWIEQLKVSRISSLLWRIILSSAWPSAGRLHKYVMTQKDLKSPLSN